MLLMSLKDMCLRTVPMLDFNELTSSATIFCVLGRGFGLFGTTAPALRVRSVKKESRSEANLRRASSKSASLRNELPVLAPFVLEAALMVRLLLLLWGSAAFEEAGSKVEDRKESRASSPVLGNWTEFLFETAGEVPVDRLPSSTSASASSSMVSVTGGAGDRDALYSSPSFEYMSRISEPSTPAIQKNSANGAEEGVSTVSAGAIAGGFQGLLGAGSKYV